MCLSSETIYIAWKDIPYELSYPNFIQKNVMSQPPHSTKYLHRIAVTF